MNHGDAYSLLSNRLNELRTAGYDALIHRAGRPGTSEIVRVNGEPVVLELVVFWEDRKHRTLRVRGTAYGPSTWMTQRLDESFVIGPGGPCTQ